MKRPAPDGAVSGMPANRETRPGKNLQAVTVTTQYLEYIEAAGLCRPDKRSASGIKKAHLSAI
ncbi:hypothetical protein [Escherichia coli]|uniref:hypothetical protein n=1 Tax=Escherichia coli TaxID=562 RepID=UPI000C29DE76|nr:hypothetical protein [Escherichia coli]PJX06361.1 hypothetical protein CWI62_02675 [Escherichia coli]